MRRTRTDDAARSARRRLELLEAELAGLAVPHDPAVDPDPDAETGAGAGSAAHLPGEPIDWLPAAVVTEPGRHADRWRGSGPLTRVADALADRLPGGSVHLRGPHVAWLGGLAAVALAVTGWWAWQAPETRGDAVPAVRVAAPAAPVAGAEPTVPGGAPGGAASPSPTGQLVVDVAGKVRRPGVITLPAGSRVHDAIERAGGTRRGVDLTGLNLARPLVDGEQVLVGVAPAPGAAASAVGGAPAPGDLVNLNTATAEQLEELPGVGPVTAQSIVEWRAENGSFTSVDELLEVDGIGEKTLADIAPHATL